MPSPPLFTLWICAGFGLWVTLRANAGYRVATWAVTFATGFGFLTVMADFPTVLEGLKAAGALDVVWLAWHLFRAGLMQDQGQASVAGFWDGVVLLLLDQKAYVIIALMFTQFLTGSGDPMADTLLITTVFTLNNLMAFRVWTVLGDRLALWFCSDASARRLNIGFAGMLTLVAGGMLLG